MAQEAVPTTEEVDDTPLGLDLAELRPTKSTFTQHAALVDTFAAILDVGLQIDKRRDVAVCQSISVLVSAFFATLESIAADQKNSERRPGQLHTRPHNKWCDYGQRCEKISSRPPRKLCDSVYIPAERP